MLKKLSIVIILNASYTYSIMAAEIKYGYQLMPNQVLNLSGDQAPITSDSDTKSLYGVYYSGSSTTTLNGSALGIKVTNSNTSSTSNDFRGFGIYSNGTNISTKPSLNLGDNSNISVTADNATSIYSNRTDLSANNITINTTGKFSTTGINLINSQATLTGNNTINAISQRASTGLAITNSSSFSTDNINIYVSGGTSSALIGVNINNNANQVANLGTGSIVNVGASSNTIGIRINDGSLIANDLNITTTGVGSRGVVIYNGAFTMNGGSIVSSSLGVTIGSVTPMPPNYNHLINLTNVNISSVHRSLIVSDGTMTLEGVTATSANNSALVAGSNSTTTANNTSLQGGNDVVYSTGGIVIFSGDTQITTSSNPNYNAIQASNGGSITTAPSGSKMNITGNLLTTQFNVNTIDLKMNSGSQLTGKSTITDPSKGSINLEMTDSIWNMTNNSNTTKLNLTNSTVDFTNINNTTLTTDQLSGTGLFNIKTDIAQQQGDLIKVTGTTSGSHQLAVTNQGSATTNGTETLTVVETADGMGNFGLTHNVEAGGYTYSLRKASNGTDWELYALPTGGGIQTSSALAGASFLNISYLLNYIDNQTLLQRLGDLRLIEPDKNQDGFWMKSFGGKLSSFSGQHLSGFDMPYWGTQLGIDKSTRFSSGKLLIGTMVSIAQGKPNYDKGDGNSKNYSLGFYTTYYHNNGIYIDTLLKYNNIHSQFNVSDTAGNNIKGKGRTQGVSGAIEIGKRILLTNNQTGIYIEPQAQLTIGTQGGDAVKANNGLTVKLSTYNTTISRTSAIIGYQVQGVNPINIYLKSGYIRELSGNTNYKLNGSKEKHSFRGEWWDNGIGAAVNINKDHSVYMDATYTKGNKFDQKQLNIGYRYNF